MRWGRTGIAAFCLMGALLVAGQAAADPPWKTFLAGHRPEADPEKTYELTDEHGPWLILAATFSGEGGEAQARDLVLELRKRYKLNAYLYAKEFDFSGTVVGNGIDSNGLPKRMKYKRDKEINEIAVLVGDFDSVDGSPSQKALHKIKYLKPEALQSSPDKPSYQQLASYRQREKTLVWGDKEWSLKRNPGPMGQAFVIRNPMIPKEFFVPQGIDNFVVQLNSGLEHSLLDCQGRFTVKVATFTGRVIIKPDEIKRIEAGEKMDSQLGQAAQAAHQLTLDLRKKGFEAFEFHDRYSSIVTVGSFDSVGTPRADGKIEINPQVHTIMQTFGADRSATPGQAAAQVGRMKDLNGIPFDVQPMPVVVPKRSVASDYDRSISWNR